MNRFAEKFPIKFACALNQIKLRKLNIHLDCPYRYLSVSNGKFGIKPLDGVNINPVAFMSDGAKIPGTYSAHSVYEALAKLFNTTKAEILCFEMTFANCSVDDKYEPRKHKYAMALANFFSAKTAGNICLYVDYDLLFQHNKTFDFHGYRCP